MLEASENLRLLAIWSEYIAENETRSAFWYLIGMSACLINYQCLADWKGDVRDFRYFDSDERQLYSFITNQKWLLFYFRLPAIRSDRHSKERLFDLFADANENTAGEWTVKIKSIDDVDRLVKFLGWQES